MITVKNFFILACFMAGSFLFSCKKNTDTTTTNPPGTTPPVNSIDTAKAVITEKGILFGDIAMKEIGVAGGTIVSADGGATLVVPPGALSANTSISIQAITNTLPQGLGDHGYQFLPDGLNFAKPARLTLKYDTTANSGKSSIGLVMANQEADGSWMHDAEVVANESDFTVTADMKHFSTWIVAKAVSIVPINSIIGPGEKVTLMMLAMDKYFPRPIPGGRRKKAIIKMLNIYDWALNERSGDYFIQGWRLNYTNAPVVTKDGSLQPSNTLVFATYTAPTGTEPDYGNVIIQGIVSNKVNAPNLIANAVVFVKKNGYLTLKIGDQTFQYIQSIGQPSTVNHVGASVVPLGPNPKIIINAINENNADGVGIYCNWTKGTSLINYDRDQEFVFGSTSSTKSWGQEYYTRDNGNGTRKCDEYGPKYQQLSCTLSGYNGGLSEWFEGTITGTLYDDTNINRAACQNSDSKPVYIHFVLKTGF